MRIGLFLVLVGCLGAPGRVEARDVFRIARNIVVEGNQAADDVVCYLCSVRVRNGVTGDVVAFGGDIVVEGSMTGDAVVIGGGIHLLPGAHLSGDAVALGGPVARDPQARVDADVVSRPWFYWPGQRHVYLRGLAALAGFHLVLILVFYLVAGLAAIFGILSKWPQLIARWRLESLSGALARHPWLTGLLGLVVFGLLLLAFYGASQLESAEELVSLIVTAVLFLLLGVGYTVLGYWLGSKLLRRGNAFFLALVGTAVLILLEIIPLLGLLAFLLFFVMALGCAVRSGYGRGRTSAGESVSGPDAASTV